ncbi:MarR family winged helix-turn-helix transcriptional regulator [Lactiplantibacillus paraplantarum]|uniref:MarR family winged helix-turn-helix transcriptional regulator n=1 Tax=Lactiplantibacillus paraplantarum TaxID=60520 RepID=UPI0023AB55FA|nr:MarR family transcriptional regulator [Lactiplantibacillus paraplantarum]WEE35568.1 MarR family transcriptional regulator [Lactiplantibacillus paraplantarum]
MTKQFGINSLGQQLKLINILTEKELNAGLQNLTPKLTGTQVAVLMYLNDNRTIVVTQKQIEMTLQLSHPTTRGIIKRLVATGLINTSTAHNDRRQVVLTLSAAGQQFLQYHIDLIEDQLSTVENKLIFGIEPEALQTFRNVLVMMFKNMQ